MTHDLDLIERQFARLAHRRGIGADMRRRHLVQARTVAVRRLERTEAKHARRDAPAIRKARP